LKLLAHDEGSRLFSAARAIVRTEVDTLLEVGPGIRPQTLVRARRPFYAEPHWEYADALERNGFHVLRCDGREALRRIVNVESVVAMDVLEHMERAEGEAFLAEAKAKAEQVVIFTPLGFVEQSGGSDRDAWGMEGQAWQRHRSGWEPKDFPGWNFAIDEKFHQRLGRGAFFAVWTKA
jgi:hypothetical protein